MPAKQAARCGMITNMSAIACPGEGLGTANLFMLFVPLEGSGHVEVTDRHTAVDYSHLLNGSVQHVDYERAEDRLRPG
jgi:hypothetical protein